MTTLPVSLVSLATLNACIGLALAVVACMAVAVLVARVVSTVRTEVAIADSCGVLVTSTARQWRELGPGWSRRVVVGVTFCDTEGVRASVPVSWRVPSRALESVGLVVLNPEALRSVGDEQTSRLLLPGDRLRLAPLGSLR